MAKYDPLRRHLAQREGDEVTLGFDEIALLVGSLPPSAFKHQAWWANTRSHPNAVAWLEAGWEVTSHDLRRQRVTFHRVAKAGSRQLHGQGAPVQKAVEMPGRARANGRNAGPAGLATTEVRLATVISQFESLLDYYDSFQPFDRRGQYTNHRRTIDLRRQAGSLVTAVADDRFLRSLYATLESWGIGKRASRLVPYRAFVAEVQRWSEALADLDGLRIDAPVLDVHRVEHDLWVCIDGLQIIDNRARLVALSKTLHHLLPELLPPIDRMYTQEFFGLHPVDFQEHQRKTLTLIWRHFVEIAQAVDPSQYVGAGWRTSTSKVIDNAIVAVVHRDRAR